MRNYRDANLASRCRLSEYNDFLVEYPGRNIYFVESANKTLDRYIVLDYGTRTMRVYSLVISHWLRNRSTIDFLGLWEQLHNPNFKPTEFGRFKYESGESSFTLTPKQWVEATGAIGITSKSGRYGGTYAHTDIAFEMFSIFLGYNYS